MARNGATNRNSSPPSLRHLGKYQLLTHLGSGGMAEVYLAAQRSGSGFPKLVVVKVLREPEPDEEEVDAEGARSTWEEAFASEAMLAARLNHPNLVQTFEAGEQDGRHVIAMEHLDGRNLQEVLNRAQELGARLPLTAHLRIVIDTLAGLHYAHELADFHGTPLGVVHCDVSPHNIFVCFDGRVKVLDFGIAKLALPSQHTETGVLKGKVRYMSPEQALGESVDRATDVFALGVVLWELLAERNLWQDKNEMQVLQALLNQEPLPLLRDVNPALPERLEAACMKALEYEPTERYPTCADFRAELLACLEELPQQISNEELGRSISGMFAAFREAQKQAISAQLRVLEIGPNSGESSAPPASGQRTLGRRRAWWWPVGIALATASGGAYQYLLVSRTPLAPLPHRVPSATALTPVTASASAPAIAEPPPSELTTPSPEPSAATAPAPSDSETLVTPTTPLKIAKSTRHVPMKSAAHSAPPPAATAIATASRSRVQLDTDNPWSSGASAKP